MKMYTNAYSRFLGYCIRLAIQVRGHWLQWMVKSWFIGRRARNAARFISAGLL